MAYSSTDAALRKISESRLFASRSTEIAGGGSIFAYCSSNASGDIVGTGFFTGCGAQPYSSSGPGPFDTLTKSGNNVGARPGDLLVNVENESGANPGKVSWHAVVGSTFGTDGYDVTVSAST